MDAIGDRTELVVVGHSLGGFTAPIVCARLGAAVRALTAMAVARGRDQAGAPMLEPWPLAEWPDVPTHFLLCRDDRMFPREWMRRMVRARLGIEADEIDGGHCPYLSRPQELAARLETYLAAPSARE